MSKMKPERVDLYRTVMEKHICPFGSKSLHLLKYEGYEVHDHWLTTRAETDAFKQKESVDTTPQTFVDGKRIGGNHHLSRYLGKTVKDAEAITLYAGDRHFRGRGTDGSGRQLGNRGERVHAEIGGVVHCFFDVHPGYSEAT